MWKDSTHVYRRNCDVAKDKEIRQTITKLLDGVIDLNQFLTYSIKFIANDKNISNCLLTSYDIQ